MTANDNGRDVVAEIIGNFGKWQLKTIIFVFLCKIPATWFMACISFTAPVPLKSEYYCISQYNNDTKDLSMAKMSSLYGHQEVLETTDREFLIDQCYYTPIDLQGNRSTNLDNSQNRLPCEEFQHRADYLSLVMQFDLLCSREMLVSLTQAFHALGGLVGGLLALHFLESIRPKHLMLIGMIGQIICGNLTGLVSTFILHVFYRCLTSVFCSFMMTAGQVIVTDITSGRERMITTILSELFASIGLMILPGVTMYCDSWNSLYVAISSSLLVFIIPLRWITESPRWLLKHGHIDETMKILLQSAQINHKDIPLDLQTRLNQQSWELENSRTHLYWTIWDGKTPRHFIALLHWIWSVAVVIYTVMILMIRLLGVKYMHVNTFCLGFVEMLGIGMGLYIVLYTRRHWLISGCLMIFAGLTTYLLWLSPNNVKESRKAAYELLFWLILKMLNSASLVVLTACTGQMVSPEKRPMLMLSAGCFSRFWLTVVPFTLVVGKIHYLLPMTMFATAAISNGIIMCYFNRHFQKNVNAKPAKMISMPISQYRKRSSLLFENI
ncbi:solute carrier family 22 member 3-like [Haematobia irritans]|uniref:solute carrier family 22 member 3-like n=1 Tax=Haematobia irritans TaxID=7368 RepID=UPI003F500ADD